MAFGSCRFLFYPFIQMDKAYEIITDADALTTLTAAPVRRSDMTKNGGLQLTSDLPFTIIGERKVT